MLDLIAYALLGLLIVNIVTIGLFWLDKQRAIGGGRRIPERVLLQWSLFGGTPGAYWARAMFRHKTRKVPFSTELRDVAWLQGILALAGGVFAALRYWLA